MPRHTDLVIKGLSQSEMLALYKAQAMVIKDYEIADDHEQLLIVIAEKLKQDFAQKLEREQMTYSIRLTESEALAYWILWSNVKLDAMNYEGLVVQQVMDAMHSYYMDINNAKQKQIGTSKI